MRRSSAAARLGAGVLAGCLAQGAGAQAPGGLANDTAWYVSVGAGANRTSTLKQAGYNRDDICYPTNLCPRTVEGYRWFYDLDPDAGAVVDLAVGYRRNALRLEVGASGVSSDIQESFTGINYFDSTPVLPDEDSEYANVAETAVEALSTRTLAFNAYWSFPIPAMRLSPYLGIGVGLSDVKLSGLYFRSRYTCARPPCSARPASEYDSEQRADLTDSVLSKYLYAGVDHLLDNGRWALGAKAVYRRVDDLMDSGGYLDHPIPDQLNHTAISGMDHWSLMLEVRFFPGVGGR